MKKCKVLGLLCMSAVLLTGCVDYMPELTTEQSDIISEYAAGLLLKYSPNYNYKIVSDEEVAAVKISEQMLLEEQEEVETTQTQTEETEKITEEVSAEIETQLPQVEIIQAQADTDFAVELGMDNIQLKYQSFEICSSYPKDNAGFSVDAAQGKKLLVVHFDLEGSAQENVECNIFDYDLKIKFNINDEIYVNALNTMLMNDITSYMDTIPAGEIADIVAVAEIDDISENELESLIIQMSSDSNTCVAQLLQ